MQYQLRLSKGRSGQLQYCGVKTGFNTHHLLVPYTVLPTFLKLTTMCKHGAQKPTCIYIYVTLACNH